jgi:hypothetical protein
VITNKRETKIAQYVESPVPLIIIKHTTNIWLTLNNCAWNVKHLNSKRRRMWIISSVFEFFVFVVLLL